MKLNTLQTIRNISIGLTLLFWMWAWTNNGLVSEIFLVLGVILAFISFGLHSKVVDLRNDSIKTSTSKTWISDGRRYYKTEKDALETKKIGERIYFEPYKMGYYIISPTKRRFFGR